MTCIGGRPGMSPHCQSCCCDLWLYLQRSGHRDRLPGLTQSGRIPAPITLCQLNSLTASGSAKFREGRCAVNIHSQPQEGIQLTQSHRQNGSFKVFQRVLPLCNKVQKRPPCFLNSSEKSLGAAGSSLSSKLCQLLESKGLKMCN